MRLADGGVLDVPELVPRVRGRDQRQDQAGGRRPRQFAERDRDTAGRHRRAVEPHQRFRGRQADAFGGLDPGAGVLCGFEAELDERGAERDATDDLQGLDADGSDVTTGRSRRRGSSRLRGQDDAAPTPGQSRRMMDG